MTELKEEQQKIELPAAWKKVNFYSLNIAYSLAVLFAMLQLNLSDKILSKAFGKAFLDSFNGWVYILLLIFSSLSGILGFVRMVSVKKVISALENKSTNE